MASTLQPIIQTFKATSSISKGQAVKMDRSNPGQIVACGATTDEAFGIAQGAASANQYVEVAMPGGGAKALAQTTIAAGKQLCSHTDGSLKPVTGANDRVIAVAQTSAVANDIFEVIVVISQASATES